jgi:hypothetical protein
MAYNVPVISDVFSVAIKELRSSSSNRKNVAEKKSTKALAPTGFFRSLAASAAYTNNPVKRSAPTFTPYFIESFLQNNFVFFQTE